MPRAAGEGGTATLSNPAHRGSVTRRRERPGFALRRGVTLPVGRGSLARRAPHSGHPQPVKLRTEEPGQVRVGFSGLEKTPSPSLRRDGNYRVLRGRVAAEPQPDRASRLPWEASNWAPRPQTRGVPQKGSCRRRCKAGGLAEFAGKNPPLKGLRPRSLDYPGPPLLRKAEAPEARPPSTEKGSVLQARTCRRLLPRRPSLTNSASWGGESGVPRRSREPSRAAPRRLSARPPRGRWPRDAAPAPVAPACWVHLGLADCVTLKGS